MTNARRKLFVNLAVEDLDRSVEFFTGLGFSFDPRFTDETATCMVVGEDAFVMLLVRERFKDFTSKELSDPARQTEAIMALTAESPRRSTGSPTPRSRRGPRRRTSRPRWSSCTAAASTTPTGTCGRSSGWTRARSSARSSAQSSRGGSPKRGNSVSVSRKNVSSTIRPSAVSSTCSAHGSYPAPVSLGLY
jgi:hypothetical protein